MPDPALRERDFVDYRADSGLHAQIDVACAAAGLARRTVCEAQNMQYLAELVQHGLGISVLPPMSVRAVTAQVSTIRITPPLRRDICAVVAARRPPTGAAQALLDILAADINSRRGQSANRPVRQDTPRAIRTAPITPPPRWRRPTSSATFPTMRDQVPHQNTFARAVPHLTSQASRNTPVLPCPARPAPRTNRHDVTS